MGRLTRVVRLPRSAQESPKGAGQYFTPRALVQGIVDVMQPGPGDTVPDPAVLAAEIMEDLQAALEAFGAVAEELEGKGVRGEESPLGAIAGHLCLLPVHPGHGGRGYGCLDSVPWPCPEQREALRVKPDAVL